MKKLETIFALLVVTALCVCSAFAQPKKLEFNTVDLDGNKTNEAIFSKADITVVNIWGTFCPPCIREMPELGEWAASMPKNVQIIGFVSDWNDETDSRTASKAKAILSKAGAKFVNLAFNASVHKSLSAMVNLQYVPTTIFVDKNGNLVGEPIIGADVDGYKKFVNEYISKK